jgi:hypothetical protein
MAGKNGASRDAEMDFAHLVEALLIRIVDL